MQYHKLRSLAISLAIVLVITRSQASGFTIRRADNWDSTTDLDTGGSSLLEVRYDLKGATAVKALDSSHTNGETESEVIAVSDYNNATEHVSLKNNILSTTNVTTVIQVDRNETTPQAMNGFSEDEALTTSSSVDFVSSTIETTQEQKTSYASMSPGESTSSIEISNSLDTKSTSPTNNENSTQEINHKVSITTDGTSFSNLSYEDTTKPDDYSSNNITTENIDINNTSQTFDNVSNKSESSSSTESINYITSEADNLLAGSEDDLPQSSTDADNETTTNSLPVSVSSTSNNADIETTEISTTTDLLPTTNPTKSDTNTDSSSEFTTDNNINEITTMNVKLDNDDKEITTINIDLGATEISPENNTSVTTEFQTVETFNTETTKDEMPSTTLPSWKVYKTINRKRPSATSVEETTLSDTEMSKAETARISLERVLNNTPIPSLLELKNDLLNAQDYSTRRPFFNLSNATELSERGTVTLGQFSSTPQPNVQEESKTTQMSKLEIVSSKRAGYLVNNKETTTQKSSQIATSVMYEDKDVSNDTDNFGTMYESEVGDSDTSYMHDLNNSTGAESQSQLVEDAIKEELLMERTLSENNLLKEEARQRDPSPRLSENHPARDELSNTPEIVTEDLLSVKPIGSDKRKNNSIYVTSSVNYKPLKKLDVQHPKQFVRDPDDNSWRNESISSLGIVFKPKNASKSFTEVLKNKTTELSNMVDKVDKSNVPDLRVRLEKIAEVRKSKKKRINKFGDTVYSDYEESSLESGNTSKEDTTSTTPASQKQNDLSTTPLTPSKTETDLTVNAIWKDKMNLFTSDKSTTQKLKKLYNLADYYDTTDDYDADYITLSKIDLKRFTVPLRSNKESATRPPDSFATRLVELIGTKPMRVTYMPDRQPTIQYFPPTKKATTTARPKENANDYDDGFNKKLSMYTYKETPRLGYDVTYATASPVQTKKFEQPTIITPKPVYTSTYQAGVPDKNTYLTSRPRITEPESHGGFVPNDGTFNRASYVIKHYKDFINDAAKGDEDKIGEYVPYTESPLRGVTMSEIPSYPVQKENKAAEDYDYDSNFRKDIMNRFVDNFNQNSERFKVDFPILYNNSVVHRKEEQNGKVLASSSAFMKRLYDTANPRSQFLMNLKPCNVNCEAMTVDLSPAYELHYYVPDQEEKEEIETRPNTLPYRTYRL